MTLRIPLLLLGLLALLVSGETRAAADDEARAGVATQLIAQLRDGEFEAAQAQFDAGMRQALPPERLRQTWEGLTAQAGGLVGFEAAGASDHQGYRIHHVACSFERMSLIADVVFDGEGRIAGLFFRPAVVETSEM
jgi:hypothetical protein